jgi:hypothetical protein
MNGGRAPLLLIERDYFFRAKIEATARRLGIAVTTLPDALAIPAEGGFSAALVDLDGGGEELIAALPALCARMPVTGFYSHVHGELARRAVAAGCAGVLSRSELVRSLHELLPALAREGP